MDASSFPGVPLWQTTFPLMLPVKRSATYRLSSVSEQAQFVDQMLWALFQDLGDRLEEMERLADALRASDSLEVDLVLRLGPRERWRAPLRVTGVSRAKLHPSVAEWAEYAPESES